MKSYASHIMMFTQDAVHAKMLKTDGEFLFDFREDPTLANWETRSGGYTSHVASPPDDRDLAVHHSLGDVPAKELIIRCNSEEVAESIMKLIYCGTVLEYPSLIQYPEAPYCYEITSPFHFLIPDHYLRQEINQNALFGCVIACRAWKREELIYSLEKYRLSLRLDSFTPHSGHPTYGQMFEYSQDDHRSHVSAAYAALTAYSIVEELGVDIRSSAQKPRFMETGEWNPTVKADVIARLANIGVTDDQWMFWSLRGTPTPMEKEIQPLLGTESEYCTYPDVRDRQLKVYEAIHYASYIRNFFLAHKFGEVTKSITPYDVHNLQSLARLLLLSALGLWKKSKEDVLHQIGIDNPE